MLFLVIREPGTAPIKGKATNAAVFIHSDIFKNDFILSQPIPNIIYIFTFRPGNNFFCFDKNDGLRNTEKHATNSWFYFRRWAAESLIAWSVKKIYFHKPSTIGKKSGEKGEFISFFFIYIKWLPHLFYGLPEEVRQEVFMNLPRNARNILEER